MKSLHLKNISRETGCEIRTDMLTRQLYATDASIYQIVPRAVAFPRSQAELAGVLAGASAVGVAITIRGAGSGLAGGAVGDGLIVDLSRYNRRIWDFDREARRVRVEAGVVLDQLNTFLQPHGLAFGPDVATSSRATLGGMIANDSSGARAPLYGTTIDHTLSLSVALPDGREMVLGPEAAALKEALAEADRLVLAHAPEIRERFHDDICKRWPGYGLDRYLKARERTGAPDPSRFLGGSEGTLAGIFSAELNLVCVPDIKGLGLIFFDTVEEAMLATVALQDLAPASIEHIDNVLFEQTRHQHLFQPVRDMLELDAKPCKAFLLVEFYDDAPEKLADLEKLDLGSRKYICRGSAEMNRVWALRKAGLSLLTGRKGPAKPVAGIEDVAVPPDQLPGYVRGLRELMDPLELEASFYGHAASGLLHVRPVLDLHKAEDIAKFRQLAEGVSALTREFRGSFTAEHGVGIARTEFMKDHIGEDLLAVMREVKQIFDPENRMNPGKIFDDGAFRIDRDLRQGAGHAISLPFDPALAFAAKDASFVGNLEQCNGCGGCRKDMPTMCPTFMATGEEIQSTRGRANTIRAVLEGRMDPETPAVLSAELDMAISNCLACRACASECPSNVNLALLKAELLYARWKREGVPLGARLVSRVDIVNKLASLTPGLANAGLRWQWVRRLMRILFGIAPERPLPEYAAERFDAWFRKRGSKPGHRGRVLLWDDCFARHNEPEIGRAAVKVLEAAGYEVALPEGHGCCGRPAFSTGRLDVAKRFGEKNVALLKNGRDPVLFLEPSCWSMFREDYIELKIPDAEKVAPRAQLFEQFIFDLLEKAPDALRFREMPGQTAIHAHCHAKSIADTGVMPKLAARIPGNRAALMETGCCGMAGQFGALDKKYRLSLAVAEDLVEKIRTLDAETKLVASGTSCRHQIEHLTKTPPLHMAELLAEALDDGKR
jgi:FAD/FMN-containing dehydrogenase/Fe-S oxidoreductase